MPRDVPVEMLNLLRFRDAAAYPAEHPAAAEGLIGAEAYRRYGKESGAVFARVAGAIVWPGRPEAVLMARRGFG